MIAAGMFLRTFREARNLSREEVAVVLKVNFETIGRWEGGKRIPNAAHFDAYATFVRAPVARALELLRDKTASRSKGLVEAVHLLLKTEGFSEEDIRKLNAWRTLYGDQAVLDAIAPDLD